MMGAVQILVFDLIAEKLAMARRLGFELAMNARECKPVEQDPRDDARPRGRGVRRSGRRACHVDPGHRRRPKQRPRGNFGQPLGRRDAAAPLISQAMRREIDILGTWNSSFSAAGNNDDWHAGLGAAAAGRDRPWTAWFRTASPWQKPSMR